MNYKMVLSILGKVLIIEAVLMLIPALVGVIYNENNHWAFLYPVIGLLLVGIPLSLLKEKDNEMYAKEGFVTVAIAWIVCLWWGQFPSF